MAFFGALRPRHANEIDKSGGAPEAKGVGAIGIDVAFHVLHEVYQLLDLTAGC